MTKFKSIYTVSDKFSGLDGYSAGASGTLAGHGTESHNVLDGRDKTRIYPLFACTFPSCYSFSHDHIDDKQTLGAYRTS